MPFYTGWETRRHNPGYDWAIIKLGAVGRIHGLDIDTANFSGNEAPEASVEALYMQDGVPGPENAVCLFCCPLSGTQLTRPFLIGMVFPRAHVALGPF